MEKYVIEDWAGNRMFPNNEFATFDGAWEFIYKKVDNSIYDTTQNENDNVYQDIFVVPKN